MNFIKWNEEVTVTLDEKSKRTMFMQLLTRKVENWKGKIVRSEAQSYRNQFKSPYVEVRKRIGGADVLFRIGYKARPPARYYSPPGLVSQPTVSSEPVSEMSMNSRAQFTPDDFEEMNLIVLEATGVVQSLHKKG